MQPVKKIITLLNKQDQVPDIQIRDLQADYTVKCSARTGEGLEEFKDVLGEASGGRARSIWRNYILTARPARFSRSVNIGSLLSEEYRADGIAVKARVPAELFVSVLPESH